MKSTSMYKKWGWVFHVLFWLFYAVLSFLIYRLVLQKSVLALLPMAINMVGLIIMVYVHLLYLLPHFFANKKYISYAIGLIVILTFSSLFRFYLGWGLVQLLGMNYEEYFTIHFFGTMMVSASLLLVLTTPFYLIENWFKRVELENELKTQQLEAELRFLKAQVNPHFLFNALNNIYSLSYTQSKKAPEMILKLSEMMSYMLYDCKSEKVNLSSEIAYLKNYIDLQQLKKDGEQNIEFEIVGAIGNLVITPMLFIPFFENAFKHGNLDDPINGWLKSKITIAKDVIKFEIANNFGLAAKRRMNGGVGLENIRKRLALIYPNAHSLIINNESDVFSVHLTIYPYVKPNELPMPDRG